MVSASPLNTSGNTGGGNITGGSGGSTGGSGGTVISRIRFTGDTAAPTVIISGHGFGTSPPTGQSNNSTGCGSYTNNGKDYATKVLWFDDVSNFAAGNGTPPNGTCIGIIGTGREQREHTQGAVNCGTCVR